MSSNDFTVQRGYERQVEIFKGESYEESIVGYDFCNFPYIRKRVLPKHGYILVSEKGIVYQPNNDFYGLDSIRFEICCDNKCNVFSTKIRVWKNIEEKCTTEFNNISEIFYYNYSYGQEVSTIVKVGISPPTGCKQFIQDIEIIREPAFGSIKIEYDKTLSYEGYLPQNSSDTIIYILKIEIDSKVLDKRRTWVIQRSD